MFPGEWRREAIRQIFPYLDMIQRSTISGRSPLEALNIGVDMQEGDVAIRANLVTLTQEENYEDKRILDHSADEITTEEAKILLEAVKKELENEIFQFYTGTSYRHCLIWKEGMTVPLTPPHDIRGKEIGEYLPDEPALLEMQKKSYEILKDHPVNRARMEKGLNPGKQSVVLGGRHKAFSGSF